jgi:pimeloyl-ACP methyl ester carboxylesterase
MDETIIKGRAVDAKKIFQATTTPTLLIRGGNSKEFTAEEAEKMLGIRAGVELATIAGAGHFVHAEKPQDFNHELQKFISRFEP